ncbi:hypothetical protein KJ786_02915 [Patescibacteria group bacterium]|nr:hypothetical protein [Patescibacteria group bacterium]
MKKIIIKLWIVVVVFGIFGFLCPKLKGKCPPVSDAARAAVKLPPKGRDGKLIPVRGNVLFFNIVNRSRINSSAVMERPSVIKKETSLVPLYVQTANLREAFERVPVSENNEVNYVLRKSFETQVAKLIHEKCQQKKELLKMVGEEFPNKNTIAVSVQNIAADEYKKAILEFLKFWKYPKIRIEISKLQKLKLVDSNNSIRFDPLAWKSQRHPVNPNYVVDQLDKFSADSNNTTNIEVVRIFKALVAETELLNSATANLPTTPTEDVNTITKSKQPEITKSLLPLTPIISKAD